MCSAITTDVLGVSGYNLLPETISTLSIRGVTEEENYSVLKRLIGSHFVKLTKNDGCSFNVQDLLL